jgi:CRISPR-associated protein Cas5d
MAAFVGEKKDEPVSYPAPTPSAARSMVEAILWKPAITWHILRIHILNPIRWFTVRSNEVKSRCDPRRPIVIEKDRTQRRLTGLRNVDYVVEATYSFTKKAGPTDTVEKFTEMFLRRLEMGQCRHQPYLGRRDFPGYFEPASEDLRPAENLLGRTIDVGRMLLDRQYGQNILPEFFDAEIKNGVLVQKGKDSLPHFSQWEKD